MFFSSRALMAVKKSYLKDPCYMEEECSPLPRVTHRFYQSIFRNYRRPDISFIPVITEVLASIMSRRSTQKHDSNIREHRAGFRPCGGCIGKNNIHRHLLQLAASKFASRLCSFWASAVRSAVDQPTLFSSLYRNSMLA